MLQVEQDYNLLVNCMDLFRHCFFLSTDSGVEATRHSPDMTRFVCTTEATGDCLKLSRCTRLQLS